jgi:thermitase
LKSYERHLGTIAAAFAASAVAVMGLLWAATAASGQAQGSEQSVDQSPQGEPYVSGELLIAFEPGGSNKAEGAIQRAGGEVEDRLPDIDTLQISLPSVGNERAREQRERALERVRQALESTPAIEAAEYNFIREFSYIPNDRFFNNEYGLKTPRYPGGWNRSRGANIRIGIVDSGVQAGHPDIRGKVVDQRDFVDGDNSANDEVGHGTHVSGIAAANTNNRRGVAGACPNCDILAAKIASDYYAPTDLRVAKGINWSSNHGADVINMSLGGPQRSAVLKRAVNRAWDRGAVLVAAAGNDGSFEKQYPAAYGRVMAVAATSSRDRRAYFSQRGRWLSVAAPGANIISTVPGGYDRYSGTSMASPNVAGLAGLLARQGRSNRVIRGRIQRTAEDLGPDGKDVHYGHGRIDAARATLR